MKKLWAKFCIVKLYEAKLEVMENVKKVPESSPLEILELAS